MLLENTEGVAQQAVVLIHGGEDRPAFIFQDLTQLFVRILSLTVFEQIWPAFVVDQGDLRQQFVDPFDIFFRCHSYFHFHLSFSLVSVIKILSHFTAVSKESD